MPDPCRIDLSSARSAVSTALAGAVLRARPGMALFNAMLLVSVFTLMLVTGIQFTQSSSKAGRAVKNDSQVYNVARAGLVDAINWFKRQDVQPVEVFKPASDPLVPTKGDSNDPYLIDPGAAGGRLDPKSGSGPKDKPSLGLVQEFQLDPNDNLWGRYEVGKLTSLERGSQGKPSVYWLLEQDSSGNWLKRAIKDATSSEWEGVQDVTENYGLEGKGLIWRIRSHGYVYRKSSLAPDGTHFYQYPNEVISHIELETEIRRLQINDYFAAIHANGGLNSANAATTIKIVGGDKVKAVAPKGFALMHRGGSVNPGSAPSSFVSGLGSPYKQEPSHKLDWGEMFGIGDGGTLAAMADNMVTDLAQLPATMSSMALTYLKPASGTATFTQTRPLNGGGILVVEGNLVLESGSASTFAGVIYVTGNYEQHSPSAISGQIVVGGNTLLSSPSDTANLEYSPDLINEVRRQLGQYRERRSGLRTVGTP